MEERRGLDEVPEDQLIARCLKFPDRVSLIRMSELGLARTVALHSSLVALATTHVAQVLRICPICAAG